MKLQGRTALITGASRGIGAATAVELARRGVDVIITSRTAEPGGKIAGSLAETAEAVATAGGTAKVIPADLTLTDEVERMAAEAAAWHGHVDIVVNNAAFLGAPMYHSLDQLSLKNWERQLTVNLTAPFILAKALVPGMRAAGGGAIVNVTSGWRYEEGTVPGITYQATKLALNRWSMALARDLRPDNIAVFALSPGFVRTVLSEQHSWEAGIDISSSHEARVPATDIAHLLERDPSEVSSRVFKTVQGGGRPPEMVADGTAVSDEPEA
jgi:NAD(P)-dependent dehydrogenase (short-subunit alcohol dehydrogenase family)